jgi:tetratricopeptide (TPR) repeat protein
VWKTMVPIGLAPVYALTSRRQDPLSSTTLICLAAVIGIVVAAILLRRRLPIFTAVATAYAITLLPVIGIFHNGQQIAADRYSYLPCLAWAVLAGGCVMAAWKAFDLTAIGRGAVAVVAVGLVLTLAALTWRQAGYWRNSEALWNHAIAIEPSFIAWNQLGMVRAGQGDRAGAIDDYHKSIALLYRHPYSHNNLGASLLAAGDWDAAIREFQIALEIKPDLATAHHGWGYALVAKGNVDEGIEHIRAALRLDPYDEATQKSLDWALSKKVPAQRP